MVDRLIESNDALTDAVTLRRRLRRDGYVFVRGLLPREDVMTVRRKVLDICAKVGWLRPGSDPMLGLTDHRPIIEGEPAWKPIYLEVQKAEEFHRLKVHPNVVAIMQRLFDEEPFALPNTIGRIAFPRSNEHATAPHQDWIYIQGSTDTLTCWAPLGDVPEEVGGLQVLVGSHKAGILATHRAQGPGGQGVEVDPALNWAAAAGGYQAGDVLMFTSLTVHAALHNLTPDHLRLSTDFRYIGRTHATCTSNIKPHGHWAGPEFNWDNIDAGWKDESLRRYWERVKDLKTVGYVNWPFNKE